MDHSTIENNNIVDLYVMGQLTPADRDAFEEHFIDCPACQQQIETTRGLRAGIRIAARDTASASPLPPQFHSRPYSWLAAGFAIAAFPGLWFALQAVRLGHQLEAERIATTDARRRYDDLREKTSTAPANLSVHSLSMLRGPEPAVPATSFAIPSGPGLVVLLLENSPAPEFLDYRATLSREDRSIWQAGGLQQSAPDALAVAVSTSLIPPGSYVLTVEGRTRGGRFVPVSKFTFRTIQGN